MKRHKNSKNGMTKHGTQTIFTSNQVNINHRIVEKARAEKLGIPREKSKLVGSMKAGIEQYSARMPARKMYKNTLLN